jgi:Cft2 family RNA processing exonuclease
MYMHDTYVCAHSLCRLIGGSLWRICWQTEDNDIVYAVSFNHRREEHLNGGVLEQLSRPSVMITVSTYKTCVTAYMYMQLQLMCWF